MRNLRKIALMLGIGISTTALATENRTPWIAERGPLRYTFEKLHTDKSNFNSWWVAHYKEAHKCFGKQSTHTQPLSALIFNKADFYLGEIFPGGEADNTTVNYSPYFDLVKFSPRVYYTEYGMTFGGRWDYKVWKKGRIGLRGQMPFRTIEMERQDWNDENLDPSTNFVSTDVVRVVTAYDGTLTRGGATSKALDKTLVATAYNFGLVKNMMRDRNGSIVQGAANSLKILSREIAKSATANNSIIAAALVQTDPATERPVIHAINFADSTAGTANIPAASGTFDDIANGGSVAIPDALVANNADKFQANGNTAFTPALGKNIYTPIKADTDFSAQNKIYYFETTDAVPYDTLLNNAAFKETSKNLWLVFKRAKDSTDPELFNEGTNTNPGVGSEIASGIDELLKKYTKNPFQFISEQGYDLDTQKLSSIGDLDLDFFYEHTFNDSWIGELFVGVRFPTGGDKDVSKTPYRPQTGNGEHWEIKLGGMIAWQPLNWMNAKLDAYYSFVLENTEHRMTAFKGASIKNMGPRADADIDWGYFVGRLDFTFFHPKTDNIKAQIGYEFYYKQEDHWNFKQKQAVSWLGNQVTAPNTPYLKDLDNNVARANTESISHKVRGETAIMINKYCEAYVSASTTFAGQHVMRDRDVQGGFNMRF